MMTVNRGGTKMQIVKQTAFGVPPIVIGHNLDQVRKEEQIFHYFIPDNDLLGFDSFKIT